MGRLEELPYIQENGQLIFANPENGCWVKMPQEIYLRYAGTQYGNRQLTGYLQAKYHLFQSSEEKKDLLQSVYFAVTGKCNMCCTFCTMNSGPDVTQSTDLPLEEIKNNVIPKLIELNPKKIVLTGGEPFTRTDIVEIIQLLGKHFRKNIVTIQTNGLLLTKWDIYKIKKSIGAIEFSIENLFIDKVLLKKMKVIFAACNESRVSLSFSFVVTNLTKVYINEALDLCHEFQAAFCLRIVSMMGRAKELHAKGVGVNLEENKMKLYLEILQYIMSKEYFEENISSVFLFTPQLRKNCGAFGNICAIHPDGCIYMCENFKAERYCLGNIREDSVSDIRKKLSKKMGETSFIKEFVKDKPDICIACDVFPFCSGFCSAERAENPLDNYCNCMIKKSLLRFNLFYKDRKKSVEDNLKKLLNYWE